MWLCPIHRQVHQAVRKGLREDIIRGLPVPLLGDKVQIPGLVWRAAQGRARLARDALA